MNRLTRLLLILILPCWSAGAHALPQIEHWQTLNGARVYFAATHELPMVNVQILFDAGSARDAHPGVASLTARLLGEGAGDLDGNALAERFDDLGAEFGSGAGRDSASLSLRSLSDPQLLQPAIDTLALILQEPRFPVDALARERQRVLVGLQARAQRPGALADDAFYQALYGDHPYAHPVSGTAASVGQLQRDDLLAHYQRHYVGRNATVVIIGDLDTRQASALADQLVGALPAGSPPPPLPPVADIAARTLHIDHPSSQTHILLGQPGTWRGDADYFPLYVGNHILGGSGLVSRISDEVREQRGLAYSAYSRFQPMRAAGPFIVGAQTRNESAAETLAVLRDTLKKFRSEGPDAAELTAARNNITGGFPLNIDSNGKLAGYLAMIGFHQLPLDYLDTFITNVEAVTAEQIRDAFQRRIRPDQLITVTAGGETGQR